MRKMMLLALLAMMAMAIHVPAALAQDDDFDDDLDDGGAAAAQYDDGFDDDGFDDDGVDDDGIYDDDEAPLPSTGGPALMPLGGLMVLGAGTMVLIGAVAWRKYAIDRR